MHTIFVGGYLRTGTTLLQTVLCRAPGTHDMVREVLPLRGHVEGLARTIKYFDDHGRDYFDDRADAVRFFGGQIADFLARTRSRWGCEHLVLKHPQLTPYFALLGAALPEARFVVIARDPADVVASAVRARARGADEFGGLGAEGIARQWAHYYTAALQADAPDYSRRVHVVRYEDLVTDPAKVLPALAAATGLDLASVDVHGELAPALTAPGTGERPLDSPLYGRGLSASRIGAHAEVLDEAQIAAIERIAGPVRAALGYR